MAAHTQLVHCRGLFETQPSTLAEAAASAGDESRVMAGGIVEWWVQIGGAVVTQAATRRNGFAVCACAQAVAAVLLAGALLCRRPPGE